MNKFINDKTSIILLAIALYLSSIFLFLYLSTSSSYGRFSDAYKFAGIAKNITSGNGYLANFSFFGTSIFEQIKSGEYFNATGVLPLTPVVMSAFFLFNGVNDASVIASSSFFYLLSTILTYLLARNLYGRLVGLLSSVAIAASPFLLDYATSGASEMLFIFEIILTFYLLSLERKRADYVALLAMIMMYFTRPQSFVFIAAAILFYLLRTYEWRKATKRFIGICLIGLALDIVVLNVFSGKFFLYSFTARGTDALSQIPISASASNQLRGGVSDSSSITDAVKKVFYNLYNFYRLLPQIMSPYLAALVPLAFLIKKDNKKEYAFKISIAFATLSLFIVTALSIPFFRYLHPAIPLIYILSIAALVKILRMITSKRYVVIAATLVVSLFVIGQTLGAILLDSRFTSSMVNKEKPPVYVALSQILINETNESQVIVTNLDTWGSWYGDRKTVWFPLTPEMLADPSTGEIPFDAIYLTNYKIDDENYYMSEEWREIFNNPDSHSNLFFREHFEFTGEFNVPADETYENEEGRGVLFTKKAVN